MLSVITVHEDPPTELSCTFGTSVDNKLRTLLLKQEAVSQMCQCPSVTEYDILSLVITSSTPTPTTYTPVLVRICNQLIECHIMLLLISKFLPV